MNVYDYITGDDARSLTPEEYHAFRAYLRFLGHKVSNEYGVIPLSTADISGYVLMIWEDGDLSWADAEIPAKHDGSRISLEEVKRMAKLGMYHEHG